MDHRAARRQRDYYARTAAAYDTTHGEDREHSLALAHAAWHLEQMGATSVLDTGCGTGRGIKYLMRRFPTMELRGNEPSQALLDASGLPASMLDCAPSEALPYKDQAFDAVVATAVLHHVPAPERVIAEMLRVSRRAIFISDSNIYAQGRRPARLLKFGLSRLHLLRPLNWLRRGGKHWAFLEGDGVVYSYSVFDSYQQVAAACETVLYVPLSGSGRLALFGSPHMLLIGLKRGWDAAET